MLVVGLVVLTVGANLLVRGASSLAAAMGISPLVVGLTVVAFGTGAPELVVCLQSSFKGQPDLALGNVIGSNIYNILLILGVSAVIVPLTVSQQLVRFEVPLLIVLSAAVLLFGLDGNIGRIDGAILASALVFYTSWAIVKSRREQRQIRQEYADEFKVDEESFTAWQGFANAALLIVGLVFLIYGAQWFVDSAITIAKSLGVSELIIGLTIVATGTSLPEIATSIVAAVRGERDIAVGNAIGSNLFNIMGVLGITSLVSGTGVTVPRSALQLDLPVMIAVAVACLPIFFSGHRIARWEGAVFLLYYVAYTASIIIAETVPQYTRTLNDAMIFCVIPLTVLTLMIAVTRAIRGDNGMEQPPESTEETSS